jgi:hypothetical protein
MCRFLRLGVSVGVGVGNVLVALEGVAGGVVVELCCPQRLVVVVWSVELSAGVSKWVELHAGSVNVEVSDVEDFELCHEWFGVGAWWDVLDEAYDAFVYPDQWLEVGAGVFVCAPDSRL